MVDGQVRPNDVTDSRIIDAMLAVPREAFVPAGQTAMAYLDLDLDVSEGAAAKRFLIKPQVLAKMLQAAEIKDTDKVLVVGTAHRIRRGRGGEACRAGGGDRERPRTARPRQKPCWPNSGLTNVTFKAAAAADGDPSNAPYDVIVLDGATEVTPERLYGQLRNGGRLVGVFATARPPRAMIVTHSHDDFGDRALFDASAPVLPGLERLPASFSSPPGRWRLLKSRFESEVWPGCCTCRVSAGFGSRRGSVPLARGIRCRRNTDSK